MGVRGHALPLWGADVAAVATAIVAIAPGIGFAYELPALHVALETAAFLIALLASFLVLGRYLGSRSASDLVLVCALATLAGANLVSALGAVFVGPSGFGTWAPLAGRILGSILLANAAFIPSWRLPRPRLVAGVALGALGLALVAVSVAVATAGASLPVGVETRLEGNPQRPTFDGHPVVVGVHLLTMSFYAAAALGFSLRAHRTGDHFMRWLALASVFAAFASVNYALYPTLYSEWVYTGDLFRLLFYSSLLVGAAREIRRSWQTAARTAVLDERRRLARDLHDGAAQELAFILRRLRSGREIDDAARAQLADAARRGLEDSRHAIAALAHGYHERLDIALEQAVSQVAARAGIGVELDLAEGIRVTDDVKEGLVRIACEAVNNAANHSGAERVSVHLRNGDSIRLRVEDDGRGFDTTGIGNGVDGAFGLSSMRDRAVVLGASLEISSSPGSGTTVEVTLA